MEIEESTAEEVKSDETQEFNQAESEDEAVETDAGEDTVSKDQFTEEEEAVGQVEINRECILKQYQEALQEEAEEEEKNRILQAKLATYFTKREFKEPEELLSKSISFQEEEYQHNLDEVDCVSKDIDDFKAEFNDELKQFELEFSEKELATKDMAKELEELRKNVALRAVHSGTGERMSKEKIKWNLDKINQEEKRKQELRLEYLKELNALKRIENQARALKVDIRSVTIGNYELTISDTNINNRKAMEKKREVSELHTSCSDAINVLTHLKHELHFLRKDKQVARARIKELQEQVNSMTTELLAMKATHEATTKLESHKLRKQFTMIQDDVLPDDYDYKKSEFQQLTEELEKLKEKYNKLLTERKKTTEKSM